MMAQILTNSFKRYFALLVTSVWCYLMTAQQAPHFAQYVYNIQTINPAFVGEKGDFSAALLTRRQWTNIEGAPVTNTFSASGRLRNGLGIGGTVIREEIGLTKITDIDIDFSYTASLSDKSRLAIGLKAGGGFFNNNLSSAVTVDSEVYESFSDQYVDIGLGALFYSKRFFSGISIPNMIKTPIFSIDSDDNMVNRVETQNYFLIFGGFLKLSKFKEIYFRPSTLIKFSPSLPVSVDVNSYFIFNKQFEAGISYRLGNTISAVLGYIIDEKIRIAYAYENQITPIGDNLNTHEIILRLDLNFKRRKIWLPKDCCSFQKFF